MLDFETTNIDNGDPLNENNSIVLACWNIHRPDTDVEAKHKFGDEYEMGELLADIKSVDYVVAQGGKFELQWLKRCGSELRDILLADTLLGAWVLDGNLRRPKNLNALAGRIGIEGKSTLVSLLIAAGLCPSKIKKEWLLEYCQRDLKLTEQVYYDQIRQLSERNQLHLFHTRNLTSAALADIEFQGLHLDKDAVQEEYARVSRQADEARERLYAITGGINLDSPKQVREFLFDQLKFAVPKNYRGDEILTGSGDPSTSAEALAQLKPTNATQRTFLEWYEKYNEASTLLSKTLTFMLKVCEEYDGKFYGVFNLGIAGTHRLTSSGRKLLFKEMKRAMGIQLQNIPRAYKRLFWSGRDDYEVGEGDGAQLEFRVATDLARDPVGIEEIATGVDVHSITANFLLEHGYPGFLQATPKERRQDSKPYTFKPLYGGSAGHSSVVKYCEFFTQKYNVIYNMQYSWALEAVKTGEHRTPYGMIFYWPGTTMYRSGRISNSTQIFNYPVQGFATGEIIPIALVHFWHRSRGSRIHIFTTIHDSLGVYVHKEEKELCKELFKQALTSDVFEYLRDVYNYEFVTPLGVEVKISRNWGLASAEYQWNVFPDSTFTYKEK